MSRLASITNQNATYASYKYLGAGRFVEEDYAAPGVRLSYDPDGDNSFSALDRFGRVVDQLWERYGQTPVVLDHYCYTYDRAGNRTSRTNVLNHDFDELYESRKGDGHQICAEWGLSEMTWSRSAAWAEWLGVNMVSAPGTMPADTW